MKWILRIGLLSLLLYILLCAALYFFQERIIFDPHRLSEDHKFRMGKEIEVKVEPGLSLNCLLLEEPDPKGVILYLHGTRGNIRRCIRQVQGLTGNQYDIFIPDYRGYGKSEGYISSEEQLHKDVQQVYNHLKAHYQENQIVIVGYSLGTGLATELAAKNQPQQLILVAPYLSLIDLKNRRVPFLPDFLLKYPLVIEERIAQIDCPITLFHGTADSIIPFDSSEKLQAYRPDHIQMVPVRRSSHRGVIFDASVSNTIRRLLP